jgi:hypothetical protein
MLANNGSTVSEMKTRILAPGVQPMTKKHLTNQINKRQYKRIM